MKILYQFAKNIINSEIWDSRLFLFDYDFLNKNFVGNYENCYNIEGFYSRGNAYHYEEALNDYNKALAINPQLKDVQENIDMIKKSMQW